MFNFMEEEEIPLSPLLTGESFRYVFIDLECTLLKKDGDILQFAAIVTDEHMNVLEVYNRLYKTRVPIRESEEKIHGISQELIDEYAECYFTEDYLNLPIIRDKDTMIVSYTKFDLKRINEELRAENIEAMDFGIEEFNLNTKRFGQKTSHYDAFNIKKKKLNYAITTINQSLVNKTMSEVKNYMIGQGREAHDALYDTANLLSLCRDAVGYNDY